jgi:hypothetical protein
MILSEEFQALIDLSGVTAAEQEWREADTACLPFFAKVAEADRAVKNAEHAYRLISAPVPFRVVSKDERDEVVAAIETARAAKAEAEAELLAAQDRSRAANDAIAAAKASAWKPVLDKAIDLRIAAAAKADALKVELARIEAESKHAGAIIVEAARNGAKLPGGLQSPPLMGMASEASERSTWRRDPATGPRPLFKWE